MANETPESSGRFVTRTVTQPPIEVDCSGWADASVGDWTRGSFVTDKATGPAIEVDCSDWRAVWLELVVSFEESTPPAKVMEYATEMMRIAHKLDPGLGLTYDSVRSRPTESGDVVIALAPTLQPSAAERIRAVAVKIENEISGVAKVKRVQAHLAAA